MILDTFAAPPSDFSSVNPYLNEALRWARSTDLPALDTGTIEIRGDRIYAIVAEYETQPREERRFEAHRSFLDVQIVASGEEKQFWRPLEHLHAIDSAYDAATDKVYFADADASSSFVLRPGDFAVFFPNDGHKPNCLVDKPLAVKKITIKVSVPVQ